MKEPKINEVFEVDNESFKCVKAEAATGTCKGCDIIARYAKNLKCRAEVREDGTNVIFKKVEENAK